MECSRREILQYSGAPFLYASLRRRLARHDAGLGQVVFCRVSHRRLLPVARLLYPQSIASHEPRPGFRGITFCGARGTVTVKPARPG